MTKPTALNMKTEWESKSKQRNYYHNSWVVKLPSIYRKQTHVLSKHLLCSWDCMIFLKSNIRLAVIYYLLSTEHSIYIICHPLKYSHNIDILIVILQTRKLVSQGNLSNRHITQGLLTPKSELYLPHQSDCKGQT